MCYLASIWPSNNLAGIVISVKILGLKFLPYIAAIGIVVIQRTQIENNTLDNGKVMRIDLNSQFNAGLIRIHPESFPITHAGFLSELPSRTNIRDGYKSSSAVRGLFL